jgi:hypothetical protein
LNLKYDILVLKVAFIFNLYRYTWSSSSVSCRRSTTSLWCAKPWWASVGLYQSNAVDPELESALSTLGAYEVKKVKAPVL